MIMNGATQTKFWKWLALSLSNFSLSFYGAGNSFPHRMIYEIKFQIPSHCKMMRDFFIFQKT